MVNRPVNKVFETNLFAVLLSKSTKRAANGLHFQRTLYSWKQSSQPLRYPLIAVSLCRQTSLNSSGLILAISDTYNDVQFKIKILEYLGLWKISLKLKKLFRTCHGQWFRKPFKNMSSPQNEGDPRRLNWQNRTQKRKWLKAVGKINNQDFPFQSKRW